MISSQMVIAAKWSFPAPKNSQVEWVADNTQYNGINIKGRKFTSKRSVDSVLEFYRQLWDGNFAEIDYGPWRMISSKHDELFYTVQVKLGANGTGSMGILGVSDISENLKMVILMTWPKTFLKCLRVKSKMI